MGLEDKEDYSVQEDPKYTKVTGRAPCGCREFYDPRRRTKVAECEFQRPRPEGCKRNIGRNRSE